MGGAASVPIAGQTLPPQQYSPRKNLIPKLEESILVPEKTSTEVTMLSKASIFDAISNTFKSDFNLLEMDELNQGEKAELLDRIYAQIRLLTVKHTPSDPKLSEYLAQYSPRKIDPKKHEASPRPWTPLKVMAQVLPLGSPKHHDDMYRKCMSMYFFE